MLVKTSERMRSRVSGSVVHESRLSADSLTSRSSCAFGAPSGVRESSSPIADLESWSSPVLLIHGDDDRNVPFSETKWLVEKLDAMGVDYELLVFPDDVHGFLLHENWVRAYEAAADFFDRKLIAEPQSDR